MGRWPSRVAVSFGRDNPSFLADELDVVRVTRKEQPAGANTELLGIGLQHRRRVALGIDADRVEEDVLANPIAQEPLHLHEPRRLERALVLAIGVDEIDRHRLALQQVVVEVDRGTVLRDQRDIRKIIRPPEVGGKRQADV